MRTPSFAATATATALAAATAGVGLLVTAPGASSADATKSSAYGLSATAGGQEAVPPTPYIESTDGSTKTTGGGQLPENPLGISGRDLTLSAGDDEAAVEVADLAVTPDRGDLPAEAQALLTQLQTGCTPLTEAIPDGGIPNVIPTELQTAIDAFETEADRLLGASSPLPENPSPEDLQALCDAIAADGSLAEASALNVECQGDSGTFELLGLTFLGQEIPTPAVPQDEELLPDNPLLQITANQQTSNADGSFSIDGLAVELAGGEAEVILANATCGEPIAAPAADTPAPPAAPAPAPVAGTAPVTG